MRRSHPLERMTPAHHFFVLQFVEFDSRENSGTKIEQAPDRKSVV